MARLVNNCRWTDLEGGDVLIVKQGERATVAASGSWMVTAERITGAMESLRGSHNARPAAQTSLILVARYLVVWLRRQGRLGLVSYEHST